MTARVGVLLVTPWLIACGSDLKGPCQADFSETETALPGTVSEAAGGELLPGEGLGHLYRLPQAGTLVAVLIWDDPTLSPVFYLAEDCGLGCDEDPPIAVGVWLLPATQQLVAVVEAGSYFLFVQNPPTSRDALRFTLTVTYPRPPSGLTLRSND